MKRIALVCLSLSALVVLVGCGNDQEENTNRSEATQEQRASTSTSTSTSEETQATSSTLEVSSSSSSETTNEVNTKNLTADQMKNWVAAIWIKRAGIDPLNDPKYEIVLKNEEDNLLYAQVEAANVQIDTLDSFRVNSEGFLEEAGYYQGMPEKGWVVVSKKYMDTSLVSAEEQPAPAAGENMPSDHERAEMIRRIMSQNQGMDAAALAAIPDEEILAANAGNATNSQIAETADNLVQKYPELRP